MKIPKQIKIGNPTYNIKIRHVVDFFNRSIAGKINYHNETIKIRKSFDGRKIEDVFFHEIAHGLLKEMEFNYPQITKFRNDEQFTQELGLHLRNLFLDLLKDQETIKQEK